jgi:hypothetical protein
MASKKTLAFAGMAAGLVTYLFTKINSESQRRDAVLQRKQVTTWEGEGGNLPPGQPLQGQSARDTSSQIHPASH